MSAEFVPGHLRVRTRLDVRRPPRRTWSHPHDTYIGRALPRFNTQVLLCANSIKNPCTVPKRVTARGAVSSLRQKAIEAHASFQISRSLRNVHGRITVGLHRRKPAASGRRRDRRRNGHRPRQRTLLRLRARDRVTKRLRAAVHRPCGAAHAGKAPCNRSPFSWGMEWSPFRAHRGRRGWARRAVIDALEVAKALRTTGLKSALSSFPSRVHPADTKRPDR